MAIWAEDKKKTRMAALAEKQAAPHCLWVYSENTNCWSTSCGKEIPDDTTDFNVTHCPHCHEQIMTQGCDC